MSQCLTERAASDLLPVHLVHRRRLDHDSRRFGSPVHVARKISATATAGVAEVTSVCAWLSASAHAPVRMRAAVHHAGCGTGARPWLPSYWYPSISIGVRPSSRSIGSSVRRWTVRVDGRASGTADTSLRQTDRRHCYVVSAARTTKSQVSRCSSLAGLSALEKIEG